MTYKLYYSPESLDDLDRVWSEVWEASQDIEVTDQYVKGIRDAIGEKKRFPKTGTPLTYMGEFTGIYSVTFKEYMAFYRLHGDSMEVGRVLYSKSDYIRILFGKSEYTLEDQDDEF